MMKKGKERKKKKRRGSYPSSKERVPVHKSAVFYTVENCMKEKGRIPGKEKKCVP